MILSLASAVLGFLNLAWYLFGPHHALSLYGAVLCFWASLWRPPS